MVPITVSNSPGLRSPSGSADVSLQGSGNFCPTADCSSKSYLMKDQSLPPIPGVLAHLWLIGPQGWAEWYWHHPSVQPRQHSNMSGLDFWCCSSRRIQAVVQEQKPSLRASHLHAVAVVAVMVAAVVCKLGLAAVPSALPEQVHGSPRSKTPVGQPSSHARLGRLAKCTMRLNRCQKPSFTHV